MSSLHDLLQALLNRTRGTTESQRSGYSSVVDLNIVDGNDSQKKLQIGALCMRKDVSTPATACLVRTKTASSCDQEQKSPQCDCGIQGCLPFHFTFVDMGSLEQYLSKVVCCVASSPRVFSSAGDVHLSL